VNTIHRSSLAFRPAGFLQPETTVDVQNSSTKTSDGAYASHEAGASSTPLQIKAALDSLGLNDVTTDKQAYDLRTTKALSIYLETRNQPMQTELSKLVSGIDLYA
jgi:hypothetical protein